MTADKSEVHLVFRTLGISGVFLSVAGLTLRCIHGIPPLVVLDFRVDRLPAPLLWSLFAGSVLLIAAGFLRNGPTAGERGVDAGLAVYGLFGLLFGRVLLSAFVAAAGFTLYNGDCFCRAVQGYQWRMHPFFAAWDHLWLAGHFYILGIGQTLVGGDPLAGARLVGIGFSIAVLVLLYLLSVRLFDRASGLAAVAVAVCYHQMTWLSLSALAAVITMTAVLGWALFALRAEEGRRFRDQLAASLCLLLGGTLRFEIYMLAVVHAVLLVRWNLPAFRSREARGGRFAVLARVALLALVPWLYQVAWMIDAARVLGDPFAHFRTHFGTLEHGSGVWDRLMHYPLRFWRTSRVLSVALPLTAGWVVLRRPNRRRVLIAGSALAYLALIEIATARGGASSSVPHRVILPALLLFFPFLGFAVAAAIRWGAARKDLPGRAVAVGIGILFIAFLGRETARAFEIPVPGYISSEINEIGREMSRRVVRGEWNRRNVGGFLFEKPAYDSEIWVVMVMSRRPEDCAVLNDSEWAKAKEIVGRGKDVVVIVRFRTLDSPYFEPIHTTGIYRMYLWHAGSDPEGIERIRPIYEHPTAEKG